MIRIGRKIIIAGVTVLALATGASVATAAVMSSGPVDSSGVIHGAVRTRSLTGLTRSCYRMRARHARGAPPRFHGICRERRDRQDPRDQLARRARRDQQELPARRGQQGCQGTRQDHRLPDQADWT